VLTPVIDENKQSCFKFWFDGQIHDGLYYHHELFYRLQTTASEFRPQLYQSACQLAQQEAVVMTVSSDTCSLWVRSQSPSAQILSQRNQVIQNLAQLEP
jgi:hypothetical protein